MYSVFCCGNLNETPVSAFVMVAMACHSQATIMSCCWTFFLVFFFFLFFFFFLRPTSWIFPRVLHPNETYHRHAVSGEGPCACYLHRSTLSGIAGQGFPNYAPIYPQNFAKAHRLGDESHEHANLQKGPWEVNLEWMIFWKFSGNWFWGYKWNVSEFPKIATPTIVTG